MPNTQWVNINPGSTQTLAAYKVLANALRSALLAVGFVQTADTGQLDINALGSVAASATQGYQIFELNDSLSGTYPIFLRVNYQTGVNTTWTPVFYMGTGTDGAGNITGNFLNGLAVTNQGTTGVGSTNNHVSRGDGWFTLMVNKDNPVNESQGAIIMFERSRDSSQAITGEGFLLAFDAVPGNHAVRAIDRATLTAYNFAGPMLPYQMAVSGLGGGLTPLFLIPMVYAFNVDPWQPRVLGVVPGNDDPGIPFDVEFPDITYTYTSTTFSSFGIYLHFGATVNNNSISMQTNWVFLWDE